ncbi:MAG: glycosyltransferase [bacterium]
MKKNLLYNAKICLFGDATNIHFQRWAQGLFKFKCNIAVISYQNAKISGIPLYDISCTYSGKHRKSGLYFKIFRGIKMFFLLRKTLRKIKPDIVHIHYLINNPLIFAFWGIKRIVVSPWGKDIIDDTGKESLLKIFYKKTILHWATEITATTKFLAKHVKHYIEREPTVISFGVDTSIFDGSKKINHDIIVISFIKHLEEKYGAKYLIETMPLILKKYKNIKLYIAGRGSQEMFLRNMVRNLTIESHVEFLGKLNHTQVTDVLRKTDIFIMPSIYKSEVFGVAAIEASAMKIPVIASDFEGIREAVVDGVTGILIPPGKTQAIADACLYLLENKSTRITMGRMGRQYVRENFEWNDCIKKMIEVYEKVIVT